ncbi:pentatricopeptide repeat-containing protein At1g62930, chloroplastic-like [Camellia sinensis]|uniref:pentatricopeptide repeat-containing protein At1g62930, chloroplastic-like n=1 Tax=Camellia sinensis TaxID=4442 RepID=UPI001036D1A1|nr:pentatricopeptide repeat-containing protein At1g62930, chloroplastic-like [Camellia sinensis]
MRILRYLKSSPGKGLYFSKHDHLSVEAYTDADWAGSITDRRSTSGYCTFVGGNLVTWSSKKQNVVARSSAEAKFRAMAQRVCELLWIKLLLSDLGIDQMDSMRLYCDNKAAINIAHNPVIQIMPALILDTARALFSNLSSKGLQPDVKTYTTMIQGFCEEGLLHDAKELFVKMEHNGCLPNDVTYNTIIRGFIGQHKCYEALILVEEMVQRGFSADASNSSLVIDILTTKGQDAAVQEVIKKYMPKDSHGMQEIE